MTRQSHVQLLCTVPNLACLLRRDVEKSPVLALHAARSVHSIRKRVNPHFSFRMTSDVGEST